MRMGPRDWLAIDRKQERALWSSMRQLRGDLREHAWAFVADPHSVQRTHGLGETRAGNRVRDVGENGGVKDDQRCIRWRILRHLGERRQQISCDYARRIGLRGGDGGAEAR